MGLGHFFRSGPGRGLIGQGFTLFSVMGVQLLQVPTYLNVLTAEEYGAYLVLIAVPSALTLADFGLLSALSTRLTRLIAAGKQPEATQVFRMVLYIVFFLTSMILVAVFSILAFFVIELEPFNRIEAAAVLSQYTVYSLLFILSSALEGAMRASNAYADAWMRLAFMRISDFACGVALLYLTDSVIFAVSGMLISRMIGVAQLYRRTRMRATWASFSPLRPTRSGMEGMMKPTIGSAALPIGNAVLNQGVVLAVNASLGPAAVAVYSTTRTIVSTLRQLSNVVSNGILPHMTQRYALSRALEAQSFLRRVFFATSAVLLASSVVLALCGQWLVSIWTLGRIEPSQSLLLIMICQVLIESIWTLIAVQLLAQNIHFGYSIFYAIAAIATVTVLYMLPPNIIEGFPLVTLAQSALMLIFVSYRTRKTLRL
ncbi:hypothetical protein [Pseudarthrobacter sulfonivorans]|uniref:lipopolysaccharide biosynthesis protein n=1 Tax=Pseudarthrobacter sulfonivorans TaxID=121292 RepID=UPI0028561ADF|nr:hypothetical protein [Pseudarthrobacter sulfonivorans]MDR6413292.1 O-antigen/teichoic acid export membrane protein [Pseudarthrobacter sulfonivorans]